MKKSHLLNLTAIGLISAATLISIYLYLKLRTPLQIPSVLIDLNLFH
ncbi:hypothetical protein [Halalkalibacillus halophilus]|nr:hypothetical protein [Halalkalibacillus halophilus]